MFQHVKILFNKRKHVLENHAVDSNSYAILINIREAIEFAITEIGTSCRVSVDVRAFQDIYTEKCPRPSMFGSYFYRNTRFETLISSAVIYVHTN